MSKKTNRVAAMIAAWSLGLGGVAAGVWEIVNAAEADHRGEYAGMHFTDGQRDALNAMIVTYGLKVASGLRYANPPVYNTHNNSALAGTGQVRIYHLIGARGVRYCVSVWDPEENWSNANKPGWNQNIEGINVGAHYAVQKGCDF